MTGNAQSHSHRLCTVMFMAYFFLYKVFILYHSFLKEGAFKIKFIAYTDKKKTC